MVCGRSCGIGIGILDLKKILRIIDFTLQLLYYFFLFFTKHEAGSTN